MGSEQAVRPEILEIVALQNQFGSTRINGVTREERRIALRKLFEESRKRSEKVKELCM